MLQCHEVLAKRFAALLNVLNHGEETSAGGRIQEVKVYVLCYFTSAISVFTDGKPSTISITYGEPTLLTKLRI
ncbi:hypothetical protein Plhal703r1_c04g0020491 [Plasmopara halstedii]